MRVEENHVPLPFGNLLTGRRAALRLSVRHLACCAGMDAGNLSRMERGLLRPPHDPSVLARLADALRWEEGSAERSRFMDLALAAGGRLPRELAADTLILRVLPDVFEALRSAPRSDGAALSLRDIAHSLLAVHDNSPAAGSPEPTDDTRTAEALVEGSSRVEDKAAARRMAELGEDAHRLQKAFDRLLDDDPGLAQLTRTITRAGARAVVFGGWARDHIASALYRRSLEPSDIDFVVQGIDAAGLQALLPAAAQRNAFDGFVIQTGRTKVDIWTVQDTLTIKFRGLPAEVDLLPSTTVFTMESVVFKPQQWWGEPGIVEDGFYQSLRRRVIDMQRGEIRYPAFQVGRALQHAAKLDLELSPALLKFIRQTLATPGAAATVREGIERFGHPQFRRATLKGFQHVRNALAR